MSSADGKQPVALVTGAAKRIGRAIALGLARRGWAVGVHYNQSADEAEALVGELRSGGAEAAALPADLSIAEEALGLVRVCALRLGTPRCLVNNASLFQFDGITSLSAAGWDAHQAVNLRAPVLLAKAFAEALPAFDRGSIVNIIDQRVLKPSPDFFSYGVAKAGLAAATTMLAQALAPRIRVNAVGPGPTARSIHQTEDEFIAQGRSLPLRAGPAPEEIAEAVLYLVDAHSVTGQLIAVDGGQHLAWRTADVVADTVTAPLTGLPEAMPIATEGFRTRVAPRSLTPASRLAGVSYASAENGTREVLVHRLTIDTVIGVHDEEKRAPQRVYVTVRLCVSENGPAETDRLEDVLDYGEVVRRIEAIAKAGHVNLVETLAERIARDCLSDPRVLRARVRIEKPDVIPNASAVGVEIERHAAHN
jgi:dihydroneopterin aldolase